LPEELRSHTGRALQTKPDQREPAQKQLAEKYEKSLRPTATEIEAALSAQEKAALAGIADETNRLHHSRRTWGRLQAVYDVGPPPVTYLLKRGNHLTPGEAVEPAFPAILLAANPAHVRFPAPPHPEGVAFGPCGATSGRRLALARWLTDANSLGGQLVARVLMNRVWQQLFGVGLVETSDNFGVSGARPSHPELLDWLAGEWLRHGWRLKPMLRELVESTAYQQSAAPSATPSVRRAQELDPENVLLWRQRLRRLEAEAIRDSLLAVSGQLVRTVGGPAVPLESRPDGMIVVKRSVPPTAGTSGPGSDVGARRSLYLLARRNYHLSLLSTFDQPSMSLNCSRRKPSAVVSQSLTMLNDEFVLEQAQRLAMRATQGDSTKLSETGVTGVIERVFLLVLARRPDLEEAGWCRDYLRRQEKYHERNGATSAQAQERAWRGLCHTLLNSSEFLYTP